MRKLFATFLIFIMIFTTGCSGPQPQYTEENCPYPDDSYNEEKFCEDDDDKKKKKKSSTKKSSKKR